MSNLFSYSVRCRFEVFKDIRKLLFSNGNGFTRSYVIGVPFPSESYLVLRISFAVMSLKFCTLFHKQNVLVWTWKDRTLNMLDELNISTDIFWDRNRSLETIVLQPLFTNTRCKSSSAISRTRCVSLKRFFFLFLFLPYLVKCAALKFFYWKVNTGCWFALFTNRKDEKCLPSEHSMGNDHSHKKVS